MWTQGPYSGSDHLPIITTLNTNPVRHAKKTPSWILQNQNSPYETILSTTSLSLHSFWNYNSPTYCTNSSWKPYLPLATPLSAYLPNLVTHPRNIIVNGWCQAAVSTAKQAEKEWRRSPLSPSLRAAWKNTDASKNITIINSKKTCLVLLHQQPWS